MYNVYSILSTTIFVTMMALSPGYSSDAAPTPETTGEPKMSRFTASMPRICFMQYHHHDYAAEPLDQMFFKRNKIFVQGMGWKLNSVNNREKDQYDTEKAVYMLSIDQDQVNGGMRLLPTEEGNYMLREIFPSLVDHNPDKLPMSKKVWESTRFFIDVPKDSQDRFTFARRTTVELLMSLYEFGLTVGIEEVIGVSTPHIENILQKMGCQYSRLSDVKLVDKKPVVVLSVKISEENLKSIRENTGIHNPVSWMPLPFSTQKPEGFSKLNKDKNFIRSAL